MARSKKTRSNGVESIQEELATIGADIASLGNTLGEFASAEARDAIKSIRERLDEIAREAGVASRAQIESVQETIQRRPLTSVAAAFGLGFILATIFRR
jgi:ElaB/YqjD/DUF883 family membrane-anchored ribosome-binding protein